MRQFKISVISVLALALSVRVFLMPEIASGDIFVVNPR